MNIGIFTKQENGDFTGSIKTFGAVFQGVAFEAVQTRGNGPDYIVTTDGGELGAAWTKTSKDGKTYLSVSFKGPFLIGPIYCALVASEKSPGTHALIWNEPKKERDGE